ncbi:peptidoglycan DD-metalloendopeptidase family protein [Phaeovibrio sulfidiphilus]|uniref:Peptidoglycan DD-metalloendopeptidase family protein n=1 Tax=Phaeovibrio sulfidiphilus TaxID=1220600 RepID=A0A8J7CDV8_9PROT|nr:peptidoglycan DD-metalloendopeptidase family protein [Phaeovibrio sulfidiphilus]MBE1237309.1 peptidoglycan DD-metalloendopeptidase family protein [Phaeovibrio sulfidiphilus]
MSTTTAAQLRGARVSGGRGVPGALAGVLLGAAVLLPADPAWAVDRRDLQNVEQELSRQKAEGERLRREAASAQEEARSLSSQMVDLARRIQDQEEALSALEKRLSALKREEQSIRDALARRQDQTVGVLVAAQRLALRPAETLLAQPTSPSDTVRVAILLREAIPHIRRNADALTSQLGALHHLDTAIRAQRAQIRSTGDKIRSQHVALQTLTRDKQSRVQDLRRRSKDVEQRMGSLTREASDMRDLLRRLDEEKELQAREEASRRAAQQARDEAVRKAAEAQQATGTKPDSGQATVFVPPPPPAPDPSSAARPFSGARGALVSPARGDTVASWGQKLETGETVKGLRIATRFEAQVVALYDGQVVFAGPFKGYGNLLIVDHGEGYHSLLAGLGRIDVSVGQSLTAGEPAGIMPASTVSSAPPVLYVELRRKGQPINPLPWLSASKGSTSG